MQDLPPIPTLLDELVAFATAVNQAITTPDIDWDWRPAPAEWTLTELICHLRDVEREVHQVRFRALLTTENPFISGATTDQWVETRHYARQNGRVAADTYLRARAETIAMLPPPDSDLWQRTARHAFLGKTTMHELLNVVVGHDRAHLLQIRELVTQEPPGDPGSLTPQQD